MYRWVEAITWIKRFFIHSFIIWSIYQFSTICFKGLIYENEWIFVSTTTTTAMKNSMIEHLYHIYTHTYIYRLFPFWWWYINCVYLKNFLFSLSLFPMVFVCMQKSNFSLYFPCKIFSSLHHHQDDDDHHLYFHSRYSYISIESFIYCKIHSFFLLYISIYTLCVWKCQTRYTI